MPLYILISAISFTYGKYQQKVNKYLSEKFNDLSKEKGE